MQAVRDVLNRVLLDGGPGRIFSADCSSAISDDVTLIKDFFAAVCLLKRLMLCRSVILCCRVWMLQGSTMS
jgi:hypothetical protein